MGLRDLFRPGANTTRMGPVGGGSAAGYEVNINGQRVSLADLFDTNKAAGSAVLASCIDKITGTAGTVPAQIVTPTGDPVANRVSDLLNGNVNPDLSGHQFLQWVLSSLCTPRGQAFAYIKRTTNDLTDQSVIEGIYPLLGTVIPVFPDNPTRDNPSGGPVGFEANVGTQKWAYAPDEILWFRRSDPSNPWKARNPLKPAEAAVALSHEAMTYLLNAVTDGVSAGGVLHLGEVTDPVAGEQLARSAYRKVTGPQNAKRVVTTFGPTKPEWIPFGMSPVDLALVQVLDLTDKQIVMALGVPRDLIFSESKYENRSAAMTELWSDANLPLLRIIEAEITAKTLRFSADRMTFDLTEVEALQPRETERLDRATKAATTNSVFVDEIREGLDLPPLPDGLGQQIPAALLAASTLGVGPSEDMVRHILTSATQDQAAALLSAMLVANRADPVPLPTVVVEPLVLETSRAKFNPSETAAAQARLERAGRVAVTRFGEQVLEDVLTKLERQRTKPADLAAMRSEAAAYLHAFETHAIRCADTGDWTPLTDTLTRAGLLSLFDPAKWTERASAALQPFIARVWHTSAERTATRFDVNKDTLEPTVAGWVEDRVSRVTDQINATTAKAVAEAVVKYGETGKDNLDELADRLRSKLGELAGGARAKLIARVETKTGWSTADHKVAAASDVATGRRWHSKVDNRVRDSHEDLHGHEIDNMVTKFGNGCLYPGDPDGPGAEVINCRCELETYAVK